MSRAEYAPLRLEVVDVAAVLSEVAEALRRLAESAAAEPTCEVAGP